MHDGRMLYLQLAGNSFEFCRRLLLKIMHCQTVAGHIYCIVRLLYCTYIYCIARLWHCTTYCIVRLLLNTSHCHELDCTRARWIAELVHFAIVVILPLCLLCIIKHFVKKRERENFDSIFLRLKISFMRQASIRKHCNKKNPKIKVMQ